MLTLNDPNRPETKPLTVEEEKHALSILNTLDFEGFRKNTSDEELIQRLINNYQNLSQKVESQEKEISNLTTDVNVCGESLQREYKRNEGLREAIFTVINGFDITTQEQVKGMKEFLKQAIENNK